MRKLVAVAVVAAVGLAGPSPAQAMGRSASVPGLGTLPDIVQVREGCGPGRLPGPLRLLAARTQAGVLRPLRLRAPHDPLRVPQELLRRWCRCRCAHTSSGTGPAACSVTYTARSSPSTWPGLLDQPGIEQASPGACELLRMLSQGGEPASAAAGFPLPPRVAFHPSEPVVRKARSTRPKVRGRPRRQPRPPPGGGRPFAGGARCGRGVGPDLRLVTGTLRLCCQHQRRRAHGRSGSTSSRRICFATRAGAETLPAIHRATPPPFRECGRSRRRRWPSRLHPDTRAFPACSKQPRPTTLAGCPLPIHSPL